VRMERNPRSSSPSVPPCPVGRSAPRPRIVPTVIQPALARPRIRLPDHRKNPPAGPFPPADLFPGSSSRSPLAFFDPGSLRRAAGGPDDVPRITGRFGDSSGALRAAQRSRQVGERCSTPVLNCRMSTGNETSRGLPTRLPARCRAGGVPPESRRSRPLRASGEKLRCPSPYARWFDWDLMPLCPSGPASSAARPPRPKLLAPTVPRSGRSIDGRAAVSRRFWPMPEIFTGPRRPARPFPLGNEPFCPGAPFPMAGQPAAGPRR